MQISFKSRSRSAAKDINRVMSFLMCALLFSPQMAQATDYDLGSTTQNVAAPIAGAIRVGGQVKPVQAGDLITGAEMAALNQIMASGRQTLNISALGNAVSGRVNVNELGSLGSLVIPNGVSALGNFTNLSSLNLAGDLVNSGNLYAYSTGGNATAIFNAANIFNHTSGLITSVLPAASLGITNALSHVDLHLNALGDIVNNGTISSSGALNLSAGGKLSNASQSVFSAVNNVNLSALGGHIVNAGHITSQVGNINILNATTHINFDGTGGVLSALNGDINVHDSLFSGIANINLLGGDWLSHNLNINAGAGSIETAVGQVSGVLHTQAGIEHFYASSETLVLGENCVTGDPTFANTAGDIVLSGLVTASNEPIAILASGNITSTSSGRIVNNGASVTLIAGAAISFTAGMGGNSDPSVTLPGTAAELESGRQAQVDFAAAGRTGGDIDLSGSTQALIIDTHSIAVNTVGGEVKLAAVSNAAGTNGGSIIINQTTGTGGIDTRGNGSQKGGDFYAMAGGDNGTTIRLNSITTSGGDAGGGGGTVDIRTYEPGAAIGSTINYDEFGSPVGGNNLIATGTAGTNAAVSVVGTINTSGGAGTAIVQAGNAGSINFSTSSTITTADLIAQGGAGGNGTSGGPRVNGANGTDGTDGATGGITLPGGDGSVGTAGQSGLFGTSGLAGTKGGNGGNITLISLAGGINVLGNVSSAGGVGGDGGNAGAGANGGTGGRGGNGGTGGFTSGPGVAGGNGGNGAAGSAGGNGADGGTAGFGGNGGDAGTVQITAFSTTGNISISGDVIASGGNGGIGGNGGTGGTGGAGGAGGIGGNGGTNFGGAPLSDGGTGNIGGIGGTGGNSGASGNGGTGGIGANITVTAGGKMILGDLDTTGGDGGAGGTSQAGPGGVGGVGGSGGNGGTGISGSSGGDGNNAGAGGNGGNAGLALAAASGGNGGNAGAISLTANGGGIATDNISSFGGAGGAGGKTHGGIGGAGGVGGAGGSGASTGATGGNGGLGANGGNGGNGSNGIGGTGGSGGNAATIAITAFSGLSSRIIDTSGGAQGIGGTALAGAGGNGGIGGNGGNGGDAAGTDGSGAASGAGGTGGSGGAAGGASNPGVGTAGGLGGAGGAGAPTAGNTGGNGVNRQPETLNINTNGAVGIDGYIRATFGSDLDPASVAGGNPIVIFGTAVSIYGPTLGGSSILGGSSVSITAPGSTLSIGLEYDSNGDLTDTTNTVNMDVVATPFAVNGAGIITMGQNGTFGTIDTVGPTTIDDTGPASLLIVQSGAPTGYSNNIDVTPAERIALIQVSSTPQQDLVLHASGNATGGSFTLLDENVPVGDFANLVIPSNVTMTVGTSTDTLTVNSDVTIAGTVSFPNGGTLLTGPLTVTTTGVVRSSATSANNLVVQATGDVNIDGTIQALFGNLSVDSTTFLTLAATGSAQAVNLLTLTGSNVSIASSLNGTNVTLSASTDIDYTTSGVTITGTGTVKLLSQGTINGGTGLITGNNVEIALETGSFNPNVRTMGGQLVVDVNTGAVVHVNHTGNVTVGANVNNAGGKFELETEPDGGGNKNITIGANIRYDQGIEFNTGAGSATISGAGLVETIDTLLITTGTGAVTLNTQAANVSISSNGSVTLTQTNGIQIVDGTNLGAGTLTVDTIVGGGDITVGTLATDLITANGGIILKVGPTDTIIGNGILVSTGNLSVEIGTSGSTLTTQVASLSAPGAVGGNLTVNQTGNIVLRDDIDLGTGALLVDTSAAGGIITVGAAAPDTIVADGGITLITDTSNITGPGTLVSTGTLDLMTNGTTTINTQVATLNMTGTGPSTVIAQTGNLSVGNITQTTLTVTGNDDITIDGTVSVTEANFFATNDIIQGSGSITGTNIQFDSNNSNIGAIGTPMLISVSNSILVGGAPGVIAISATSTDGTVNYSQSGTSTDLNLDITSGSLTINSAVTLSTQVTINVEGTVNAVGFTVTAPALTLFTSGTGNSTLATNVGTLTTGTALAIYGNSLFINETDNITLLDQDVSNLTVSTTGTITLGASAGGAGNLDNLTLNTSGLDLSSGAPFNVSVNALTRISSLTTLSVTGTAAALNCPVVIFQSTGALTFATGTDLQLPSNPGVGAFISNTSIDVGNTLDLQIVGADTIVLDSPSVTGNVGTNVIAPNIVLARGAGVLANPNGDLNIPQNLIAQGDVAILASGNVISSKATKIDLSSKTSNGGNLLIVAGFDFNGTASTVLANNFYDGFTPSASGGSVYLPKVSIVTTTSAAGRNGGSVRIYAHAGNGTTNADSPGLISVGTITTSATATPLSLAGNGGNVDLIGQGGVLTKGITAKGTNGGNVTISGAEPTATSPLIVNNGVLILGGFNASALDPMNGAGIVVSGNINTNGINGTGGSVSLVTDSQIRVGGSVLTNGFSRNLFPDGGGDVTMRSLIASINVTMPINTSGLKVTATTGTTFAGGNAGNIILTGFNVNTNSIIAKGADNNGTGGGGSGGSISINDLTDPLAPVLNPSGSSPASIIVSGFIDGRGGNALNKTSGNGGSGGAITIDAAQLLVKGTTSGSSIIASGGTDASIPGVPGGNGAIDIGTYAVQTMPTNLDFTSKTANVPVLAGGLFTIAQSSPVNGVAGKITSGATSQGFARLQQGDVCCGGTVTIAVTGVTMPIDINGTPTTYDILDPVTLKRDLLTPSEAVAYFQVSRNGTQDLNIGVDRTATSGSFTFDSGLSSNTSGINGLTITSLKIPATVDISITGPKPVLNLTSALVLNPGTDLQFDAFARATIASNAAITIGAGNGLLPAATMKGDVIILSGSGAWTNNGQIIGADGIAIADLVLARPTTAPATFTLGLGSLNNYVVVLGPTHDVGMSFNFKGMPDASNSTLDVRFDAMPISASNPILAGAIANNGTLARTVALTFSLMTDSGTVVVPQISGNLSANTISIKGLTASNTTFGKVNNPVTLLDGTTMRANTNLTVTTLADLVVGNIGGSGVFLTAGALKSTAAGNDWNNNLLLTSTDFATKGALTLTGATVTIGDATTDGTTTANFVNNGAKLLITATNGEVQLGTGNTYRAMGGNVNILAKNDVLASGINFYQAKGVTGTATGGIEVGAGSLTSNMSKGFASKATPTAQINVPGATVIPQALEKQVVLVVPSSAIAGGQIDLAGTGNSTLNLTQRGVMVFGAAGTRNILIQGGSFETKSSKPIGYFDAAESDSEVILDSGDDEVSVDELTMD